MLSVVVTIVDGGDRLVRCLNALTTQTDPPPMEIIVPYDDTVADIAEVTARFPSVRFLNLGKLATERPAHTPAGAHELYDRRRSAGLEAADGDLIALLQDRGAPRPTWARAATAAHADTAGVIGGAVENVNRSALNWAVYLCDYGRYQLPFTRHAAAYVSDVNICYKRRALMETFPLWRKRYHESTVHWAMRRNGEQLLLTPEMVVEEDRGRLRLWPLLIERFEFGRLFALTRVRECTPAQRAVFALAAPALPFLLAARIARRQISRSSFQDFLRALPALLGLLVMWSLGEAAGYVSGRE